RTGDLPSGSGSHTRRIDWTSPSLSRRASAQHEEALLGEQVGEAAAGVEGEGAAGAVQCHALLDDDAERGRERHEIPHRAEVDVRRVVPAVVEEMRHGHAPHEQDVQPNFPVAEIRERYDRAPADPYEMLDDDARVPRRLQGLAEDDVVEGPGG